MYFTYIKQDYLVHAAKGVSYFLQKVSIHFHQCFPIQILFNLKKTSTFIKILTQINDHGTYVVVFKNEISG